MAELRNMLEKDLPAINALLVQSFSQARRNEGCSQTHIPFCAPAFLSMYLADAPHCCLAYEDKDKRVVAALFGHVWGQTAWIGPFAVAPHRQQSGLGRTLLQEAIVRFKAAGACVIGLETSPRSFYNL